MPSKESGFRNDATPEDDLMIPHGVKGETRLFFRRNRSRRIVVASW